jgi:hypothetical protein
MPQLHGAIDSSLRQLGDWNAGSYRAETGAGVRVGSVGEGEGVRDRDKTAVDGEGEGRGAAMESMTGLVMYYKTTGFNTVAHPAQLWVVRLEADGSALAAGFDPVNLLNQTEKWEAKDGIGCIEAPAMHRVRVAATATATSTVSSVVASRSSTGTNTTGSSGGVHSLRAGSSRRSTRNSSSRIGIVTDGARFLLFYSGGNWEAGLGAGEVPYSMGIAACDTPLGPCTKLTTDERGPWFGYVYRTLFLMLASRVCILIRVPGPIDHTCSMVARVRSS